jgi:hypothetical protein
MRISLIGPSYPAFSHAVSVQQSLNMYPETVEVAEGKVKQILRGRPGLDLFKDLTTINAAATPLRGLWAGGGRLFAAAGTKVLELDIAGALVGTAQTVVNDNLPVDMLANGNQLFVVSGGKTYCNNGAGLTLNYLPVLSGRASSDGNKLTWLDEGAAGSSGSYLNSKDQFDIGMLGQVIAFDSSNYTVAAITNPSLLWLTAPTVPTPNAGADWSISPILNATRGAFLDGYFVVSRPSSRQFNISRLLDGSTWGGLDFAYKEGYPDNLLAVWAEPPLLYLLGTETLEVWRNTGRASFPLERIDGGFARVGLAATWSPASIQGRLHMLAGGTRGQAMAVRMEGVTPVRISSYALEEALKTVAFPNNGWSYTYEEGGHLFWVLHFGPGGMNSWVYDATEALRRPPQECWHERNQWNGAAQQSYIPAFHAFIPEWNGGMHIIGDPGSGKLYRMGSDLTDDDGGDIRCRRTLAYVYNEGRRIFHHRLEVEMETGVGSVPVIHLDWSDDRGETWGTGAGVGTTMTMGPQSVGVFTTRFFAVALGSSRGRVYRLTITGKGRVVVLDATLEMSEGLT